MIQSVYLRVDKGFFAKGRCKTAAEAKGVFDMVCRIRRLTKMVRTFSFPLWRRFLGFGCCLAVLGLLGCGRGDAAQVTEYQNSVIVVLQGDGETLPNFTRSIGVTLKAAYCAQYNCIVPSEMEQLRLFAEKEVEYLAIYRERACKTLATPKGVSEDAVVLCDGLMKMLQRVQDLARNAELARDFLARDNVAQQWNSSQQAIIAVNELKKALSNTGHEDALTQLEAIKQSLLLIKDLDGALKSLNSVVRVALQDPDSEPFTDNLDTIQAGLQGLQTIEAAVLNLNRRILGVHDRILVLYDELRVIAWLGPIFENAAEELPGKLNQDGES